MERTTEQSLIARAAAGDRAAAAALIQAHQASLYAYVLRMSGRADVAEDVVQEAFYRALRHIDRYDPQWRFSTWLFTIARRVWLNERGRRTPRCDSDMIARADDLRPVWSLSGWTNEERVRSRDRLEAAMDQLSDEQREALVLFHQLEWPIRVIATVMELPEGTVKSHLHRARGRLRELLTTASGQRDDEHERAPLIERLRATHARAQTDAAAAPPASRISRESRGVKGRSGPENAGVSEHSGSTSGPPSVAAPRPLPALPHQDARASAHASGDRAHRRREAP